MTENEFFILEVFEKKPRTSGQRSIMICSLKNVLHKIFLFIKAKYKKILLS